LQYGRYITALMQPLVTFWKLHPGVCPFGLVIIFTTLEALIFYRIHCRFLTVTNVGAVGLWASNDFN
jgi:hypothetical protein